MARIVMLLRVLGVYLARGDVTDEAMVEFGLRVGIIAV